MKFIPNELVWHIKKKEMVKFIGYRGFNVEYFLNGFYYHTGIENIRKIINKPKYLNNE